MVTIPTKAHIFTVGETHGRALRVGNRLIANSQDAGWRSLHAAIIEEGPFSATEPAIGHPMLIYHLTRPTEVTRKIEGVPGNRQLIGPRRICLTPGEATTRWEHHGHPEILQVYLRGSMYQAAVSEIYNCDTAHAELVPRFAILDPMLEQLAIAIKAAVGQSPHRYVLARRVEKAKELLRNTELPVVDVALSSGFSSQSHLSYWFQRYVGVSPAAYRQHRAT